MSATPDKRNRLVLAFTEREDQRSFSHSGASKGLTSHACYVDIAAAVARSLRSVGNIASDSLSSSLDTSPWGW